MVQLLVVGLLLFGQQLGPPSPQIAPPVQTHVDVTVQAPAPDDGFVQQAGGNVLVMSIAMMAPIPAQWLKSEIDSLPNLWTQTPPLPDGVRAVSRNIATATSALGGFFVFIAGLSIMLKRQAWLANEYLWRFLFATFVSANNLTWWDAAISINNGICQSIAQPNVAQALTQHLATSFQKPEAGAITDATIGLIAGLLMGVVLAVVGILTLLTLLTRLGIVFVAAGAGPLALFMWVLPQLEGVAVWYTRIALGTLFSQIAIVIGFATASSLVAYGSSATTGVLLAIVVLLVVRMLPGLMQQMGSAAGRPVLNGGGLLSLGLRLLR